MPIDATPFYPDVQDALAALSEEMLRDRVLPVLLRRLDFVDVRVTHGPHERGKDLLAWRVNEFDLVEWCGFVVKVGDITAQVASTSGIRTVLHQVEQVLDHEVVNPLDSTRATPRACWVVTTGRILPNALDDVSTTLRRHHLDKLVRWVDGTVLLRLLSRVVERPVLAEVLDLR